MMKPLPREKLLAMLDEQSRQKQFPNGIQTVLVVDDESDELHLFAQCWSPLPRITGFFSYQRQTCPGTAAQPEARHRAAGLTDADDERLSVLEEMRQDPTIRDIR